MGRGRRRRTLTGLFVDTSAWYPLAVASHPDHKSVANALRESVRGGARIVTTNLVVAETHALLLRRPNRLAALDFVRAVHQPPNVVAYSNPELENAARTDWLERYQDQDFSLTAAVSFAVMADLGIRDALALDRHFTTAGFVVAPG